MPLRAPLSLRADPRRHIELPGEPKAIVEPAEAGAEAVVVERHQHLAAFRQAVESLLQRLFVRQVDEQRHRRGKAEVMADRAIGKHQVLPIKIDGRMLDQPPAVRRRIVMLHLHEPKTLEHLAVKVDRPLRLSWNMTKVET